MARTYHIFDLIIIGAGTAGLAAGTVLGNLLEAERRRRNLEANNIRDDSQGIV